MTKPITFAICGCGSRGLDAYAVYQKNHPDRMRIVAGAAGAAAGGVRRAGGQVLFL